MSGTLDPTASGPWLVKSGDRILGPYSTENLNQLVRDKEVVVIDEIMAPQSRWAYLRDVPAFQNLVDEIRRGLMQSREDTEVQGYTNSGTTTASRAETLITEVADLDVPALPPMVPNSVSQRTPVASVMIPRDRSKDKPVELENRNRPSRSGVVIGAVALVLAVGFILYWATQQPHARHAAKSGGNLQTQASVAWKRGEFDQALQLYREIDHQTPGSPLIAARLATLMMRIEGQTVEAKRIIETALPNAGDAESTSALKIASGLAALQTDDPKEAAVQFAKAREASGRSQIASFDEGVAQYNLRNWRDSIQSFEKAAPLSVALLMTARAYLSSVETDGNRSQAQQAASKAIEKALALSPDYQQEELVLGAYIDLQAGQKKSAATKILEAINTDPNQTTDHFHDPALSLDNVSWPKLIGFCRAIHADLDSRASGALLGLCLAKAGQVEDASKVIEQEIMKEANNPSLQAVNAYLHLIAGREDAARASLTLSSKSGNSRLAQILAARLCTREGQAACAEDGWSKLAASAHPPIASIIGLAQIRSEKGDQDAANALMVSADRISPTYLPLLRLREEASR